MIWNQQLNSHPMGAPGPLWVTNPKTRIPEPQRPFLFNCGCSTQKIKLHQLLRELGVYDTLECTKIAASRPAKAYIQYHHLDTKCPRLGKHTYIVLMNPKTMELLDLMAHDYQTNLMKARKLLNGE